MDVSEDLQREVVYQLNALLLSGAARSTDIAALILRVFTVEGPRFHEPALLEEWAAEAVVEPEELVFELEEVVASVVEELEDAEEPWSAHRVLTLLEEEPLWCIRWGLPGGELPAPIRRAGGVVLPLDLRPALVAVLDELELRLFDAHQDQRSVHDRLAQGVVEGVVDTALRVLRDLGTERRSGPHLSALIRPPSGPALRAVLVTIQHWKLSVVFDASPDQDDGEWTLRVLERLYGIEWSKQRREL